MEMKRGEVRDFGQSFEVQRLIEMLVDVLENSVHPTVILGAASTQSGFTWRRESFGCNGTTQWSCRNPRE